MRLHTQTRHIGRVLLATGVAMIGLAMTMGPVSADGNNGTIKIDGVDWDTYPDNEPHVSCTFQVDFYGYEAGLDVTMDFSVQPPTGGPFEVIRTVTGVLDDDDASGAGSEAGIDSEFPAVDLTRDLFALTPHPNQGYHVKLTITADDETKSKTYWVGPCAPPQITEAPTTTTTLAPTTAPPTTASVLGVVVTKAPTTTAPAQVLGVQLPRTGLSEVFLMAGLMAVSLGLVFEGLAQLAKRRSTIS